MYLNELNELVTAMTHQMKIAYNNNRAPGDEPTKQNIDEFNRILELRNQLCTIITKIEKELA